MQSIARCVRLGVAGRLRHQSTATEAVGSLQKTVCWFAFAQGRAEVEMDAPTACCTLQDVKTVLHKAFGYVLTGKEFESPGRNLHHSASGAVCLGSERQLSVRGVPFPRSDTVHDARGA